MTESRAFSFRLIILRFHDGIRRFTLHFLLHDFAFLALLTDPIPVDRTYNTLHHALSGTPVHPCPLKIGIHHQIKVNSKYSSLFFVIQHYSTE